MLDPIAKGEDAVTEAEWLAGDDPLEMFSQVVRPMRSSRRRLDLLCLACVRLVWHLLDHPALRAPFEWLGAHPGERVRPPGGHMRDLFPGPAGVLYEWRYRHDLGLNTFAVHIAHDLWADFYEYAFDNLGRRSGYDLGVLRDDPGVFLPAVMPEVYGNPFRPVVLDPSWRTEAVAGLAAGIHADRSFERLPVLADALEAAGCGDADLLAHCRGDVPHVRGCWALDLVLGTA